jgi:ubiquinone/menaquinone biosynthesis C-methylase UbiE
MSLPFATDYFDSCRSERLFQLLPNPAQALSERTQVTKSGGWIVVLDTDWGSLSTDAYETDIERRLARFLAESFLHNGYSGRKLYRLFKQQNVTDISYEVFPVATSQYALARQIIQAESNRKHLRRASLPARNSTAGRGALNKRIQKVYIFVV